MNRIMSCFTIMFLLGGCSSLPAGGDLSNPVFSSQTDKPILFVADPQIHNIYGMKVKQMEMVANMGTRVAVRPPELNVLAPLVMNHLIKTAKQENEPEAIIVLGDGTNVACTGEYQRFAEYLEDARPDSIPLLMAHGNHDSYLMGTVNSYVPIDEAPDWAPVRMQDSPVPTDENWWGTVPIDARHDRNWRDGCFQPGDTSAPMNKSSWLAKYLDLLAKDGAIVVRDPENSMQLPKGLNLAYTVDRGSLLGKFNFSAIGKWVPPELNENASSSDLERVSDSFLVQKVDLRDARVIIIDTSVCEIASAQGFLGYKFFTTNAGTHACLGDDQMRAIKYYLNDIPANLRLVIAGHFPMNGLNEAERTCLIAMLDRFPGWTYMSAHTHNPVSETVWNSGWEINVGSTTDWPMEVNSVWFSDKHLAPRVKTFRNVLPRKISYNASAYWGKAEVCRHLRAAEWLADLEPVELTSIRSVGSSKCNPSVKEDWDILGEELQNKVATIERKFKDKRYQNMYLEIAGAASRDEYESIDVLELLSFINIE